MADPVDISSMPDPTTIGLSPSAQADPTADMPTPAQLFRQHKGYDAPSPEELGEFMRNPDATPDVRKENSGRFGLSMLSGLPSIAAQANPITPVVAAGVGGLNALPASIGAILSGTVGNNPDEAARLGQVASDKLKSGAASVYNLANYLPSKIITKEGQGYADAVLGLPQTIAKSAEPTLNSLIGEPATTSLGEWAGGAATLLPAAGVKGVASGALKLGKAGVKAAKASLATAEPPPGTTYDQTGTAVAPDNTIKPDVDGPVTGDTLRAAQNPIPAPEGTLHHTLTEEGKSPAAPSQPTAAPSQPAPAPTFVSPDAEEAPTTVAAPTEIAASRAVRAGEITADEGNARLAKMGAAQTPAPGNPERGSTQLFSEPTKTGPQATPEPAQQGAREQSLNDVDKLSGGMLPSRRASALSGDYNATGDDYQLKEVGSEPMRQQLASENSALHAAAENVHASVGSQFNNSVDPQTVSDRGRVTRGAIQGIQDWFEKATDNSYDAARAAHGDQPMPTFLARAGGFLRDDANYMPEGFRRAAQARLEQLRTAGDKGADGSTPAAPSSVAAAEKFREWLNQNRTLDNMHAVKQLVTHTDMDVAEHSGPTLFQAARDARRHQYQMLEEPTGIRKLLTPSDSQGINHAIPEHKVMDYIADLPQDQHAHVLNVLRAGAHLGKGELAEQSAAAIREIQAHMISRMHDAATNADGTWNARKFYNQASSYAPKLGDTFRDQPKTLRNLQTLNRAGNTLSMDKHYPGAAAQAERTGLGTTVLKGVGGVASSLAHEIPLAGRLIGRGIEGAVEGMSEKSREAARDKVAMSRLVDRNGKQRGSVQLFNDNKLNRENEERTTFHGKDIRNPRTEYNANSQLAGGRQRLSAEQNDIIGRLMGGPLGARVGGGKQRGAVGDLSQRDAIEHKEVPHADEDAKVHRYTVPGNGGTLNAVERAGLGVTQGKNINIVDKGKGWGTRTLQRAVDDTHARGQVWHSDDRVSEGHVGSYKNLASLGYDVKLMPHDKVQGEYKAVGDHVFEVRPGASDKQRGSVKVMRASDAAASAAPGSKLSARELLSEMRGSPSDKYVSTDRYPTDAAFHSNGQTIDKAKVARYAKMPGDTAPPVLIGTDGSIVDGHHRVLAARARGESEIKALAPKALVDSLPNQAPRTEEEGGGVQVPPGMRGSFSFQNDNPLNNATTASRNKQRGGTLNIGLNQGNRGEPGFRQMSKQEATGAVESTGAKVTKNTVLMPKAGGPFEPTSVMSTDRPLTHEEMQQVLAKTKQSAIPQRTDAGEESMHVAPGHEEIAKREGWDKFNGEYFRGHDGTPLSKQRGSVRVMNEAPLKGAPEGDKPSSEAKNPPAYDKQTATPEFKNWFGKSKVTQPFNSDKQPLPVFHGTTGDFSKFSAKGSNPESDHGKGFYFSNEPADVEHNYAGKGPDLTQKIDLTAERLMNDGMTSDKAYARAHQQFMKHGGMTMPAYLRIENPAIIGDGAHGAGTELTHEFKYENPKDPESAIVGEKGTLPKFSESLRSVALAAGAGDRDMEHLNEVLGELHERAMDGSIPLNEAIKKIHDSEALSDISDDQGNMLGHELVRRALQKMGYDGIIDHDVNKKFGTEKKNNYSTGGMKGMNPDTVHYIAFKPHQIKSAIGNSGKFSRKNADITAKNESTQSGALA